MGGPRRGPLAYGDTVLLIDRKDRRHLVTLAQGAQFHTHTGPVHHADLVGLEEGDEVRSARGARYLAVRPTMSEYVTAMPRGAQIIYPKDVGAILVAADVFPGARVFESGVGSGSLSMALLRAVGPEGHVLGYELRDDFAERARRNVAAYLGPDVPYDVELRDAYEGIDARELDRVVLDLPEPWHLVPHAERALRPGGILVAYVPSVIQVSQLRDALVGSRFGMAHTFEVLHRGWHVDGVAVRPDHRMVAHTGFLTTARLLARPPLGRGAAPAPAMGAPTPDDPAADDAAPVDPAADDPAPGDPAPDDAAPGGDGGAVA
jgi:tRNA (adenine57-N1/adenine58-N1)-methyltransferase